MRAVNRLSPLVGEGGAFHRRLNPGSKRPIAVAYSGGGDSLATLIATVRWAERAGRSVIALHVDHRLQAASGEWARLAESAAVRLGARFIGLAWTGEKPARGLAAAARKARHALIAEAARAARARVVVFGHTADDILEAEVMRAAGSSLGRLQEWGPSPAWPEGRDVFLLRPLLALRRAAIRERLAPLGLPWIEDPANADPGSARARARMSLDGGSGPPAGCAAPPPQLAALAGSASFDEAGGLTVALDSLAAAPPAVACRFLSAALVCVGGGDRPPRRERIAALLERLNPGAPMAATLAGAKVSAGAQVRIAREAGAYRRQGPPELRLEPGAAGVWDGRFALRNRGSAPCIVRPLAGLAARLSKADREELAEIPAAARGALPAIQYSGGLVTSPVLAMQGQVTVQSLVAARFRAACGVISKELGG